jgi:hypothetical protein
MGAFGSNKSNRKAVRKAIVRNEARKAAGYESILDQLARGVRLADLIAAPF